MISIHSAINAETFVQIG